MTVPLHLPAAAPPDASDHHNPPFLRLPFETRLAILQYIWPSAIHIEAHPKRPTDFRHYECRQEFNYGHLVRHPAAGYVMRQEVHFVRDERHPACGALQWERFYEEIYEEDEDKQTWFSTHASAWRNHFLCEWDGAKKVESDDRAIGGVAIFQERSDKQPPSGFLPLLLVCKRLTNEMYSTIGKYITFCFTDLWTPVEFFDGPKSPPISKRIHKVCLSANPFLPPQSGLSAWESFLTSCIPPSLTDLGMWLELTQPVHVVAEDGGDQYRQIRETLVEMKIPPWRRVRVSVPLDPLSTEDLSTPAEREMLANGCIIMRRGKVHEARHRFRPRAPINELGMGPSYQANEEDVCYTTPHISL